MSADLDQRSSQAATGQAGSQALRYVSTFWSALGGAAVDAERVAITGSGSLPSMFPVTDFAAAAVGVAGLAISELMSRGRPAGSGVTIDRRLSSHWFSYSLRPTGWKISPAWDAIAGDYPATDGWIRLHTNAPHHRAAAEAVLGVGGDRETVAQAVKRWQATELETAIVAKGGCAAAMRSFADWAVHPQGSAVAAEPLVYKSSVGSGRKRTPVSSPARPLSEIRVLDLTRVLAGPVATRFLAGYGARVLRIDPPFWDEPSLVPDVTVGKRCARLDLRRAADFAKLERLLSEADVMVHGYRADALARIGLDAARRRELNPALIDVSLDAYGWEGPWKSRRGFDSLVQMSCGIAHAGMQRAGADRPVPLPVQALDHATGYLLAAAVIRGITHRATTGEGTEVRASLARTAHMLVSELDPSWDTSPISAIASDDFSGAIERTIWGEARRLKPPVSVEGAEMRWDYPAGPLGSSPAQW